MVKNRKNAVKFKEIEDEILTVRNQQVILDSNVAGLYDIETKWYIWLMLAKEYKALFIADKESVYYCEYLPIGRRYWYKFFLAKNISFYKAYRDISYKWGIIAFPLACIKNILEKR
jgi:hypothetical protein